MVNTLALENGFIQQSFCCGGAESKDTPGLKQGNLGIKSSSAAMGLTLSGSSITRRPAHNDIREVTFLLVDISRFKGSP